MALLGRRGAAMRRLRFIVPLALFIVLVGFLAAGLKLDPRNIPSPLIGKPAPAFALTRLEDETQTIRREDLLGKVWLLNVWASWCAVCRDEHPHLIALARSKALPLFGLNYKDRRADGRAWLARLGDPYEASLWDGDGRIGVEFGVYGAPETFLIDKQGVIRFKHIGAVTPEVIQKRILPLVKGLND
jgi:cytochrome c biogenesis protein CcmG/thiol:disulfide interchange protein DsbE